MTTQITSLERDDMKKEIKVWAKTPAGDTMTETFESYFGISAWAEKHDLLIFNVIDRVIKYNKKGNQN